MSPPVEAKFKYNLGVELMQKVKGREFHANVLQNASHITCWYPKELEICPSNVETNKGGLLFFNDKSYFQEILISCPRYLRTSV
jgi:hypothetical protein